MSLAPSRSMPAEGLPICGWLVGIEDGGSRSAPALQEFDDARAMLLDHFLAGLDHERAVALRDPEQRWNLRDLLLDGVAVGVLGKLGTTFLGKIRVALPVQIGVAQHLDTEIRERGQDD